MVDHGEHTGYYPHSVLYFIPQFVQIPASRKSVRALLLARYTRGLFLVARKLLAPLTEIRSTPQFQSACNKFEYLLHTVGTPYSVFSTRTPYSVLRISGYSLRVSTWMGVGVLPNCRETLFGVAFPVGEY